MEKLILSYQWVKVEALLLPNLYATIGILANSHCSKLRGSYIRSWKNLKLQKIGRQSTISFQVTELIIQRIYLGR